MYLPRKMTKNGLTFLQFIGSKGIDGVVAHELLDALDKDIPRTKIPKIRFEQVKRGYVEFNGDTTKITPFGVKVLANVNNMKIMDSYTHSETSIRKRKNTEPEPQEIKLNISKTATNVADSIAHLISENEQLRELLRSINEKINQALEL